MDLFTEFKKKLTKHGLEYFGLYYGVYRGKVADHSDPEFRGRVKISVPQIYKETIPDKWVSPRGVGMVGKGHGAFFVPRKGDPIFVSFENGDTRFPLYESGWWLEGGTPETAKVEEQNAYVIQTPNGMRIELNDAEEKIHIEDKAGFQLVLDKDGLFIGKGENNLGAFLDELFEVFSRTTAGPYPFTNASEYVVLGEKIKSFLKS